MHGGTVPPVSVAEAGDFTVATQQPTDDGGWVDLLLERPGEEVLVVEVKVGAPEGGPQIARYRKWLDGQPAAARKAVYSLVRHHDPLFRIKDHGGTACRRWRGLYDHLQSRRPNYTETVEEQLIQHLCNYLEAERIVSTWNPQQILDYGPGVIAKRALRNLFEQIATRLADREEDYETKILCDNDAEWPRLEVGGQAWASVFGAQGNRKKVCLFFQTKVAWQGEGENFCLQIVLWHHWHHCDWRVAKKKLPAWEQTLRRGATTCGQNSRETNIRIEPPGESHSWNLRSEFMRKAGIWPSQAT